MTFLAPHSFARLALPLLGVLVAIVASPSVLTGQAADEMTLDEWSELIRTGEYEEAVELVDAVPASPERLVWHARLLRETGKGAEALKLLSESKEYEAGDAAVRVAAGGLRVELGDWETARKDLELAVSVKGSPESWTRLGLLLLDLGEREAGLKELKKVLDYYRALSGSEARALDPEVFVWMGRACEGLNRYRDAYDIMYSSALDLDPENAWAHVASGHALLAKYNYPDARSHFKDAIAANPALAEAHIGLAYSTYVDFQYPRNRFIDTLRALAAADRTWPDHPDTLVMRGHLALYDENWTEAEDYYRRAVAARPRDLSYRAYVGVLLYAMARLDELKALEAEVATLHPRPAEFYATLAEKLVDRFFYAEAADFARRAVEIDPEYWPAYVTLGVNALRAGRDEEGKEYIEKAFQNDKFNVW
ncbi:MAG: tetratricopeptide repeat protein, partial [Planctomycetes bacterium]|nr:tetratricopeptide repeat protein [Planctomycetota bacterium]